jgi:hypothetical protein
LRNTDRQGIGPKDRLASFRGRNKLGRVAHGNSYDTLASHALDIKGQLTGTRRRIVGTNDCDGSLGCFDLGDRQIGSGDGCQHSWSLIAINDR